MVTVGLDFGTHQTKICIEDATNTNQKTYDFFEFLDNGKSTFFLPSVVQINEDGTLSYGSVDQQNCKKVVSGFKTESIQDLHLPVNISVSEPVFFNPPNKPSQQIYPKKPQKNAYPKKPTETTDLDDWKSTLLAIKNKMLNQENSSLDEWRRDCKRIDLIYSYILKDWQSKCKQIDKENERVLMEWESTCHLIDEQNSEILKEYEIEKTKILNEYENAKREYNFRRNQVHYLSINEEGKITEEKFVFHYFKFALYSDEVNWLHQIDPETISIWYLTHILFLLREKLGEDFFIQIGIPCGIQKKFHKKQKEKAICTLIAAYNLLENYQTHNKFLAATFEELLDSTEKITHFSEDDIAKYGVDALPEAYAGLVSLTQKKKLEKGMNLLVDIGGGTTDIAFFTITEENLPDIHSVYSLYKGLNFIYENVSSISEMADLPKIQRLIDNAHEKFKDFEEATLVYKTELQGVTRKIINSIKDSFINSTPNHRLHIGKLNQAMRSRPVIYSGGGSTFKELIGKVESFSDTLKINKEMLSITTLKSEIQDDNMFAILSTAYGLSIPLENEIILTDISEVFSHIISLSNQQDSSTYDHGLTDY